MWDLDSKDWKEKIDPKIFQKIKPGSILLFHDCYFTSLNLSYFLREILKNK
jgi:hypothetical protein